MVKKKEYVLKNVGNWAGLTYIFGRYSFIST